MATQPPVGAQEMPLLRTKLYIPPIRPEWVLRPRLIERLDVGLGRKLTLVSAPAGFGKTTMIGEWIHRGGAMTAVPRPRGQASTTPRFAWLSLDEGDNDPTRFLTYLVAALQAAVQTAEASFGRGALSALQSPQPPPVQIILTTLINELAALPNRIVLVLDDYHLIQAQPVHDALTFLLRHLTSPPGGLHLVIATREDPPLPLSRLRARGQLTEPRATDLRFTPSEAAEFLNRVMGLDLSAEDSAALETRTGGWIAGLQLAALALQGALANQAPRQGRLGHKVSAVTGFIQSFTGSHHFVLDYLVEEVLEQQPKGIQVFLLQTALLDRITGPLCDALTGQSSSQATLEMLDHSNLFIVPLDDERRWYRYHHLFADLLFHRLKQTQAEQLPTLQRRASEWHEKNGFVDEAIEYALRAEDFGRAAHLIEDHVDVLWGRGENNKLGRWLDGLPEQVLFSNPYISIFGARLQYLSGQLDAAERTLQAVEQALASTSSADSDSAKLRGRTAATRAGLCNFRQDVPGIIHHARQALQDLPMEDLPWRGTAAFMLGNAYGFQGNMTASCKARLEALTAFQAAGDLYYVLMTNQHIRSP